MSSNWSEQQKARTEVKEQNKVRREKLAGYFFDLSKVTFGGLVIGGLSPIFGMHYETTDLVMLFFGLLTTITFAIFANNILK